MRGKYEITHQDRAKFFHALLNLMKPRTDDVDLISTQLSLSNCADLLEELGYYQDSWDIHGWEGEVWAIYSHKNAPTIYLSADAYCGCLNIGWSDVADGIDIEVDALREVLVEKWGKYFPVI